MRVLQNKKEQMATAASATLLLPAVAARRRVRLLAERCPPSPGSETLRSGSAARGGAVVVIVQQRIDAAETSTSYRYLAGKDQQHQSFYSGRSPFIQALSIPRPAAIIHQVYKAKKMI